MNVAEITKKMIAVSNGNLHDIDHFLKVWAIAKTIGELEALDPQQDRRQHHGRAGDLQNRLLHGSAGSHHLPICRTAASPGQTLGIKAFPPADD